ncbi:MAG: DedA family protein [Isosphaeraceae bacterium]|nr:DedA family protein [Isosphaeraceae bacterium]
MEFLQRVIHTLLHLSPETMNDLAHYTGPWLYVVILAIVFAETGLVVTPFLPGDSLLFAVGAVAAHSQSPIHLPLMALLLIAAAILGDAVNYFVGYRLGPKVFSREDSWLLNKKHLLEAQRFYEKHGGKTIILARFVPIVRTFAPFVAGIGRMNYLRFALYNVTGGIAWVLLFLLSGWWFGGREVVQKNFKLVIVAIIVISVLPAVIEYLRARAKGIPSEEALIEATTTIGEVE